jgi:hypothetical protein
LVSLGHFGLNGAVSVDGRGCHEAESRVEDFSSIGLLRLGHFKVVWGSFVSGRGCHEAESRVEELRVS